MALHEFDLLVGRHIQADKSKPIKGPDGKPTGRYEQAVFNAPAVVPSDIDLAAKHGNEKFRYRGRTQDKPADFQTGHVVNPKDEATATSTPTEETETQEDEATLKAESLPSNLYSMTVVELKQYAEDNEIDLGDATRKDDLVKAIKKAHGGK